MRMNRGWRARLCALAMTALMLIFAASCALASGVIEVDAWAYTVEEDGWYDTLEEVAIYIDSYGGLPDKYLTKKEAQNLGWNSSKGNLWDVAEGCSIGGDRFGNYEGLLPDEKGRKWTECDIDYGGGRRGAKRIVFSNDGLIYYTDDHYESFDEVRVLWDTDTGLGDSTYNDDYDDYGYDEDVEEAVGDFIDWLLGA